MSIFGISSEETEIINLQNAQRDMSMGYGYLWKAVIELRAEIDKLKKDNGAGSMKFSDLKVGMRLKHDNPYVDEIVVTAIGEKSFLVIHGKHEIQVSFSELPFFKELPNEV